MQAEPTLRALRDRPFELLLALESRARDVAAGQREGAAAQEWIGVAFRMGGETFLVERDEAREVMGLPAPITRVPWLSKRTISRGETDRLCPNSPSMIRIAPAWCVGRSPRRTGGR
jgi:hypothetical protein